jgi:dCTP deaminase
MENRSGSFWSGETLIERLPDLIKPFTPERVDCAAYTLAIGPEVYVSPTDQTADPSSVTVRRLTADEGFTIPPGQFAFLLSEEIVSVPPDALAFISIRAKSKFRGLVNVSGFHVDPGYKGQLTFAVFNAGPVTIHLRRGQSIFLIWYANLDRSTAYRKDGEVRTGIDTELVTSVSGELLSFAGLSKKIKDVDEKLADRVHAIEKEQTYYRVIAAIALAVVIAVATIWVKDFFATKPQPAQNQTSPTSMPALPAPTPTPQPTPVTK